MTFQRKLPSEIRDWLRLIGRNLLCTGDESLRINVERTITRREANIYFCTIANRTAGQSICVKQFTHAIESDVEQLFQRSRCMQPALDEQKVACPRFLAHNQKLMTIAMTTEAGKSLETLIVHSFLRGAASAERCKKAIENLAVSQAALNKSRIPESAHLAHPCSNQEYFERIQEFLQHPFVVDFFCGNNAGPRLIFDNLPTDFWSRHEKRLLHGDFQAKNVLVGAQCDITLLDMDFGRGHPLFDVAQFLTQLIRLSRRWRYPKATRLLKMYGDRFIACYSAQGFEYLRCDLPFFMTWSVTFSLLGDAHYSAPVRSYIKRHLRSSELAKAWGLTFDVS